MSKFCTKNALLENLKSQNFKKLLLYLKSAATNCLMTKLQEKAKMHKFGTKNALFAYFWARIQNNSIVIFKTNTLKFVYLQNFRKKNKNA